MAPVQSREVFDDDSTAAVSEVCPKTLLELIKSNEDYMVNPELGVSLDEVVNGGAEHRIHKGKMKRSFFNFLKHDSKYSPFMENVMYGGVVVPRLVVSCMPDTEGTPQTKCRLVNKMLKDFAATMKLKSPPP